MNFFVDIRGRDQDTAAIKAPADMGVIMEEKRYIPIKFDISLKRGRNFRNFSINFRNFIKVFFKMSSGDVLIYQYPYGLSLTGIKMLSIIYRIKKIKLVFLVHDLDSLRGFNKSINESREAFLKWGDCIICHNRIMKQYLVEKGIDEGVIIELGIFDYLNNSEYIDSNHKETIIIAGNLDTYKSSYLDKLLRMNNRGYHINLYGPNFTPDNNYFDYTYFGSFTPEELPKYLKGAYGLVWDGDSLDQCNGPTGNYLKYNNPHKASLYISCGIPVIIWKEAALAEYISNNKLGYAINSLNDIKTIVSDNAEYEYILEKNREEAKKLRTGYYLKKALDKVEKKYSNTIKNNNKVFF